MEQSGSAANNAMALLACKFGIAFMAVGANLYLTNSKLEVLSKVKMTVGRHIPQDPIPDGCESGTPLKVAMPKS